MQTNNSVVKYTFATKLFLLKKMLQQKRKCIEHHTCGTSHGFGISGNMNCLYMELVQNKNQPRKLIHGRLADTFEIKKCL
jgi:hypothetical protein